MSHPPAARRLPLLLLAAVALVAGLFLLWNALRSTPEKAVRRAIEAAALACEAEDAVAIADFVDLEWRGEPGASREEIVAELNEAFREVEELSVEIFEVEAKVEGDEARAVLVGVVSGVVVSAGGVYNRVPFRGIFGQDPRRPEAFYLELKQGADAHWRLQYVTWELDDPTWDEFPRARKAHGG